MSDFNARRLNRLNTNPAHCGSQDGYRFGERVGLAHEEAIMRGETPPARVKIGQNANPRLRNNRAYRAAFRAQMRAGFEAGRELARHNRRAQEWAEDEAERNTVYTIKSA